MTGDGYLFLVRLCLGTMLLCTRLGWSWRGMCKHLCLVHRPAGDWIIWDSSDMCHLAFPTWSLVFQQANSSLLSWWQSSSSRETAGSSQHLQAFSCVKFWSCLLAKSKAPGRPRISGKSREIILKERVKFWMSGLIHWYCSHPPGVKRL